MEHWLKKVERWQKGGVTSLISRVRFYLYALTSVTTILFLSVMTLWVDRGNTSTLHKLVYVFLDVVTIPYVMLLVTCMRSAVPVPSSCLGPDGRLPIYFATMQTLFCTAYFIKEEETMKEMTVLAVVVIVGVIAIVQLYHPAKDLDENQLLFLVALGALFGFLGAVSKESWTSFIVCLCCFPLVICAIYCVTGCGEQKEQDQHLIQKEEEQHRLPV